ncbi:uncharacterized protein LOC143066799 [Mytilus galloprovincialis]|uniref:uncharacterized protein LOC143066799 n=1 Tax=Mytilus galloprovincialis TaxID=29158 RepID=UPI003F7CACCF
MHIILPIKFQSSLLGDTPKEEHLRSLGEKWGRTSEEEKMEFRIQAKEIRDDPLKGRTAEEIAEVHLNTITNSCAVLQSLGYEIAAIAAKESEPSQLFGTPRGLEFVKGMQFQKGFRESVFRHIVYVGDDRTHKDTKKELTENVRKIFNSCWASASLKNQAVPYGNIIKNNLYRMEGLPDGVIFKDPNSYGLSTLRQIISQKDSIKFVNVIPATTLASSATPSNGLENEIITEDTDAPAIPLELREEPMEAVADAVDITIGVSGTLAHAVSSDAVGEHGVEVLTDLSNMHMEEITGAPEIPLDVLDSLAATIQVDVVEEQTRIIVPKDEEEENGMYKVVSVLDKKKIGKKKQFFLVHWEGYNSSDATWEPRKNIPNYFIKCFNKNQTKKSK